LKKIYFLFYLRLQETVPKSSSLSVTKKVIIGVAVACVLIIIIGGVLGGVLSHEGSERKYSKFNKLYNIKIFIVIVAASEPNVTTSNTTLSSSSSTNNSTSSMTSTNPSTNPSTKTAK